MPDSVNADDIRKEVVAALGRLRRLSGEGRIVMAKDSWNTDRHDSAQAVKDALLGLESAAEAMLWMQTLPHPEGGYPPIED